MKDVRGQAKMEREFHRYFERRQQERLEEARKRAEQARQFAEFRKKQQDKQNAAHSNNDS